MSFKLGSTHRLFETKRPADALERDLGSDLPQERLWIDILLFGWFAHWIWSINILMFESPLPTEMLAMVIIGICIIPVGSLHALFLFCSTLVELLQSTRIF